MRIPSYLVGFALVSLVVPGCAANQTPSTEEATTTETVVSSAQSSPAAAEGEQPSPDLSTTPPTHSTHQEVQPASDYSAGVYRLKMHKGNELVCDFHQGVGEVASCVADFPHTWKLMDGDHEQAGSLFITRDASNLLNIEAEKSEGEFDRNDAKVIDQSTTIAGMIVNLTDDEVEFSTPDSTQSVFIGSDSYGLR